MDDKTTEDKALDPVLWLIASVLDYPSAYMGGPSLQSRKKAERIINALDAEGWTLTKETPREIAFFVEQAVAGTQPGRPERPPSGFVDTESPVGDTQGRLSITELPQTADPHYRDTDMERRLERLRNALRGGNATNDNATMLEFLADRLVEVYGENPNVDFIRAARERAAMIRAALQETP